MSDLDAEVQDLKDRIATAMRNRARAEHEHDAARAQAEQIRERLDRDFQVTTVDEAKALYEKCMAEYGEKLAELRAALDDIEA